MTSGSSLIVLDTNIVLYHLSNRLKNPLVSGRYALSSITELELLSYAKIEADELRKIENFISMATVVELTTPVKRNTINLRRKYPLKLPDAIIAGTALWLGSTLFTNDGKLLSVTEIETQSVVIS